MAMFTDTRNARITLNVIDLNVQLYYSVPRTNIRDLKTFIVEIVKIFTILLGLFSSVK